MTPLTLSAIHHLALTYVPLVARIEKRLLDVDWWGPAHEIGHALVATPEDRTRLGFGVTCDPGHCSCPGERCHVVELAAMDVSRRLVTSAGAPRIAEDELWDTSDYDRMAHRGTIRAAQSLIERLHLQRLPRTVDGLERLLRRRIE